MAFSVLIVDDSAADRDLYNQFLHQDPKRDYAIFEAENVSSGLELYRHHQPHCTILDFMMTQEDGTNFLAEIASPTQKNKLPIIFLTAYDDEALLENTLEIGAFTALSKRNLTPEMLCTAVEDVLQAFPAPENVPAEEQ